MVKICLRGLCKEIQITPNNGEPTRCMVRVQLDHNSPLTYRRYDLQFFVPAEFASLLEVGLSVAVTLEQDDN